MEPIVIDERPRLILLCLLPFSSLPPIPIWTNESRIATREENAAGILLPLVWRRLNMPSLPSGAAWAEEAIDPLLHRSVANIVSRPPDPSFQSPLCIVAQLRGSPRSTRSSPRSIRSPPRRRSSSRVRPSRPGGSRRRRHRTGAGEAAAGTASAVGGDSRAAVQGEVRRTAAHHVSIPESSPPGCEESVVSSPAGGIEGILAAAAASRSLGGGPGEGPAGSIAGLTLSR